MVASVAGTSSQQCLASNALILISAASIHFDRWGSGSAIASSHPRALGSLEDAAKTEISGMYCSVSLQWQNSQKLDRHRSQIEQERREYEPNDEQEEE
jgi:hypothetical protein